MINLIINRRDWFTDQDATVINDTLIIDIADKSDSIGLGSLADGDYYLEDCKELPYNPITSIKVKDGNVSVELFLDDAYKRGEVPDFKRVSVKVSPVKTSDNDLAMAKEAKSSEISEAHEMEIANGKMYSAILGINVDYRRGGTDDLKSKNDAQNVELLIKTMKRQGITETIYSGYEAETAPATLAQIEELLGEMADHGVYLYQKKGMLKDQVEACTTIEAVKAVLW